MNLVALLFLCFCVAVMAQESDKYTLENYANTGFCMYYLPSEHVSSDVKAKGQSPCKTWCPKQPDSDGGVGGCFVKGVTDFDKAEKLKDHEGREYLPGKCQCIGNKQIDPIVNEVAKGLEHLDNIICAVGVEVFKTIAEVAVDLIPGGGEVNAAIEAAKTFAENALDAAAYFDDWVGKLCGVKDWSFNTGVAFGKMNKASASRGVSKGCFRSDKSVCKKAGEDAKTAAKDRPKPTATKDEPETTKKEETTTKEAKTTTTEKHTTTTGKKPAETTHTKATTTTTADACNVGGKGKRAANCPHHITTITKSHSTTKLIKTKCLAESWEQACYHMTSVLHNYPWIKNEFSCTDSHYAQSRKTLKLHANQSWKNQHKKAGWWQFTQPTHWDVDGKPTALQCEADEFPPAYFMTAGFKQDIAGKSGQLVRWIPQRDNGGTGRSLWKGFCAKHDGGKGNAQYIKDKINDDLVTTKPNPHVRETSTAKGDPKTYVTEYEVEYQRAVLAFDFEWHNNFIPSDANNWGLEENACWPKDITPDNPGYVLVNDDEWYNKANHKPQIQSFPLYAKPAPQKLIDQAKARQAHTATATTGGTKTTTHTTHTTHTGKTHTDNTKTETTHKDKTHTGTTHTGKHTETAHTKAKTTTTADKKARGLDTHEHEEESHGRLQFLGDALGIKHNNGTRRLTPEELSQDIEVIDCKDALCTEERKEMEDDENVIFIPGEARPTVPSFNFDAAPTKASTLLTITRPQTRGQSVPDMPSPTQAPAY